MCLHRALSVINVESSSALASEVAVNDGGAQDFGYRSMEKIRQPLRYRQADVEADAARQFYRTHGHSKIQCCLVDLLGSDAFFQQSHRLQQIGEVVLAGGDSFISQEQSFSQSQLTDLYLKLFS